MSSGITVDYREFDAAMVQYAAASKKDSAWVVNKNCQEIAIRSIPFMRKANVYDIVKLGAQKDFMWWLAWKIKRRPGAATMTRTDAYTLAGIAIQKRMNGVAFLKSFFVGMSRLLAPFTNKWPPTRSGRGAKNGTWSGFRPTVTPATPDSLTAITGMSYEYKPEMKTSSAVQSLLNEALQQGVVKATANMREYIEDKMATTARTFSAR